MRMNRVFAAIAVALALTTGQHAAAAAGQNGRQANSDVQTLLSAAEIETLNYMREEEKLARDLYLTLFQRWNLPVFDNISEAEQRHADSVADMIEKYRLPDPVVDDSIGVFVNPELAGLYASLVERGNVSSLQALYAGAAVEETDIIDLQTAMDETDRPDIDRLYDNLVRGSRNHLRAFVRLIENQGIAYEAQYLDQDVLDAIVDSPVERGGPR